METAGRGCELPAAPAPAWNRGAGGWHAPARVCTLVCTRRSLLSGLGARWVSTPGVLGGAQLLAGGVPRVGGRSGTPSRGLGRAVPCHHLLGASVAGGQSPLKTPLFLPVWLLGHVGSCPSPSCSLTPGGPPAEELWGPSGAPARPRAVGPWKVPAAGTWPPSPPLLSQNISGGRQGGGQPPAAPG